MDGGTGEGTAPGIIEDIATLARGLGAKEPYRSATGPEALLAFAARLEEMAAEGDPVNPRPVNVAVRSRRKKRN